MKKKTDEDIYYGNLEIRKDSLTIEDIDSVYNHQLAIAKTHNLYLQEEIKRLQVAEIQWESNCLIWQEEVSILHAEIDALKNPMIDIKTRLPNEDGEKDESFCLIFAKNLDDPGPDSSYDSWRWKLAHIDNGEWYDLDWYKIDDSFEVTHWFPLCDFFPY